VRNLHYVVNTLDADHDGWPEGLGNVERTGMGPEKLDNTVYFIRGLYDLADMANSKHDDATVAWAKNLASELQTRFDSTWWYQAAEQYADSLNDPGNVQSFRSTGSARRPWRWAERQRADSPGPAPFDPATLRSRSRGPLLQRRAPAQPGLFHRLRGGPNGAGGVIWPDDDPVGRQGNYGRLSVSSSATPR
jgi:hypothetical protein